MSNFWDPGDSWFLLIREINKHCKCKSTFLAEFKKDSRSATLPELNVEKGSVSTNKILNLRKFLPCIVLREIVGYINVSKSFLWFGNALSK